MGGLIKNGLIKIKIHKKVKVSFDFERASVVILKANYALKKAILETSFVLKKAFIRVHWLNNIE